MNILHTSDWHIGRTLYGRKRYEEFEAFLAWLVQTIEDHDVKALLVAGDIFDTSAPSHRAQALYYQFLCRVAGSACRHVVVIAGNHDSPSFLSAPKELLKALDVHVVGSATPDPQDEVLVLRNQQGVAELMVCAVPYLRDRDIRTVAPGESVEEKEQKMLDGIRNHYAVVVSAAQQQRQEFAATVPLVAMGHLFTAGGQTIDGDGVRELYVGSLAHVSAGIFPSSLDYVALGHLHVPQKVGGLETIRYSGSPLPMGFGEAKQQKSVCLVSFAQHTEPRTAPAVRLLEAPVFQQLERVQGDLAAITQRITELSATASRSWLEIIYSGEEVLGDLRDRLEVAIAGTQMQILRIKNTRIIDRVLGQSHAEETLDELNVNQVFERCLAAHDVSEEQRPELLRAYQEALSSLYEDDALAE